MIRILILLLIIILLLILIIILYYRSTTRRRGRSLRLVNGDADPKNGEHRRVERAADDHAFSRAVLVVANRDCTMRRVGFSTLNPG